MNIKNLFGQQPPQAPIPQAPRQPWIPTREEMMRLNALIQAVTAYGPGYASVEDIIFRADKFFTYLSGEMDVKEDALADRKWWQF